MRNAFQLLITDAQAQHPGAAGSSTMTRLGDAWWISTLASRLFACLINDMLTIMLRGGGTGTEPSIIKIFHSELLRDFTRLAVEMGGVAAQYVRSVLMGGGYETGYWMHDYLYSWACTIAGGANEIQRNIIAERR